MGIKGRNIREIAKELARRVPLAYGEWEIDALTLAWEASKEELAGDEHADIWLRVFALYDEAEQSLITDEWIGAIGERWVGLIGSGQYVDLRARADDLHRDIEAGIVEFSGLVTEIVHNQIVEEILQEHLGGANSTRTVKQSLGLLKSQSPDWFLQWEENASEKQIGWVTAGKTCGLGTPGKGAAWFYYERLEPESDELRATALMVDLPTLGSEILEAFVESTEDLWVDVKERVAVLALQSAQYAVIENLLLQDRSYGYPALAPTPPRTKQMEYWRALATVLFVEGSSPPQLGEGWHHGEDKHTLPAHLFLEVDILLQNEPDSTRSYLQKEANAGKLRVGTETVGWPGGGQAGLMRWIELVTKWIAGRP